MDVIGRYTAIVLSVILIILFPLQYIAQSQDETMENVVYTYADELANLVRHQGFITLDMYEEFVHKLNMTGEVYDITIESSHPITGKEAAKQTVGDTIPDIKVENTSFIDKCSCEDYACEGNICGDDFCNNSKCNEKSVGECDTCQYQERTNELLLSSNELLSSHNEINSLASHSHTNACYAGHRHISSCSTGYYTGPPLTNIKTQHYYSFDGVYSAQYAYFLCDKDHVFASLCINNPEHFVANVTWDQYYLNDQNQQTCKGKRVDKWLQSTVPLPGYTKIYENFYTKDNPEWSIWRNITATLYCLPTNKVLNQTELDYLTTVGLDSSLSCPHCLNLGEYPKTLARTITCGQEEDVTPVCNQVVTAITATYSQQTVSLGSDIIATANATMLDGSTKKVSCSVTGYDRNKLGKQMVTLTYSGLVDNAIKTSTKTCTIIVTVTPSTLTGIIASPETVNVERYNQPVLTVIASYDDASSRTVTDYTLIGYNSGLLGRQEVTVSYTENGITKTVPVSVTVNNIPVICPSCGKSYTLDDNDLDNGCPYCKSEIVKIMVNTDFIRVPNGSELPITVIAVYTDGSQYEVGVSEWSSNYRPELVGLQEITISYLGLTTAIVVEVTAQERNCPVCGLNYSFNEDGTDPGCPYCSKEVIGIDVLEESVTIEAHMNLPITVMVTFKDGHTAPITDWTTNLVADSPGTYEVTIYYQAATDTISVTIVEEGRSICPYCGLAYDFSDSPAGCPDCSKILVGLEASLRSGGTKVMYKSQLNLELVLIYKDTHRRITYTGWTVDGYRSDKLGTQTITIHYENLVSTMIIEVVDELPKAVCQEGHEYYLDGDGSDPGCPYCNQEDNKEKAVFYFENTYTTKIIETLYRDGIYQLREGDYLTITVTKRNTSLRSKIKNLFFGTNREVAGKKYTFGGEVLK